VGKSAVLRVGGATLLFVARASLADEAQVDITPQQILGQPSTERQVATHDEPTEGLQERPRHPGLVLESTLGVLGFAGNFRHVAPPAYWVRGQLGYEVTRGLMVYADGEAGWTDTSESQEEANTFAVVLWGFGGGLRGTVHWSERVAIYAEGEVGALTADVIHDELTVLGFRNAESLNPSAGARVGIEWYQLDRHLALAATGGARYAVGFAKVVGPTDLPLMWDAGLSLRYTF
jgi:hypothetical protein